MSTPHPTHTYSGKQEMTKKATTLEKTAVQLEGAVYHAAVKFFEALEHEGCIIGNGHHAAQNVANEAVEELRRRWNSKQEEPGSRSGPRRLERNLERR